LKLGSHVCLARLRRANRSTAASTTTRSPFPAGQYPPVNAFWSVTMYDGKSLLVANPINRYLINSPMLPGMKKNADESLTLYIQKWRRRLTGCPRPTTPSAW